MIIGAYVMGLSLSKTDLAFLIQDQLRNLQRFLVPIFFCVMGMLVNFHEMTSSAVILFGLVYLGVCILSKIAGCGIPALFLNFTWHGALRVGTGMIPRGEVALIIAGIGLSSGIISHRFFSIAIMMTFITTLVTPALLAWLLELPKPSLRKQAPTAHEHQEITYAMPNPETAELILGKVIKAFENEGFYVSTTEIPAAAVISNQKR